MEVFIAVLFTRVKNWKQEQKLKFVSPGKWLHTMGYIPMKYYLAIK